MVQTEIPVPEQTSTFARETAVAALAAPYLAGAPEATRERWARPLPVAARVALLRALGAHEGDLRELLRLWAAWRGNEGSAALG